MKRTGPPTRQEAPHRPYHRPTPLGRALRRLARDGGRLRIGGQGPDGHTLTIEPKSDDEGFRLRWVTARDRTVPGTTFHAPDAGAAETRAERMLAEAQRRRAHHRAQQRAKRERRPLPLRIRIDETQHRRRNP